ncbi:MAG TPA: YciI family protein [Burkholderiaceae bacterium]|nr:YciI family protein [Burkholderiaceae bacterium]
MTWLITARYRPAGAEARLAIRDQHLDYLLAHTARLRYGGALLSDDEPPRVTGMFIAIDAASRDDAGRFIEQEPYHRAGLFASVTLERLNQFVPNDDPRFLANELRRERERLGRQT